MCTVYYNHGIRHRCYLRNARRERDVEMLLTHLQSCDFRLNSMCAMSLRRGVTIAHASQEMWNTS